MVSVSKPSLVQSLYVFPCTKPRELRELADTTMVVVRPEAVPRLVDRSLVHHGHSVASEPSTVVDVSRVKETVRCALQPNHNLGVLISY